MRVALRMGNCPCDVCISGSFNSIVAAFLVHSTPLSLHFRFIQLRVHSTSGSLNFIVVNSASDFLFAIGWSFLQLSKAIKSQTANSLSGLCETVFRFDPLAAVRKSLLTAALPRA